MALTGKERIDVIEDFEYNSENPQYNQDYLQWRRHTKGPFLFQFSDNSREHVYVDGAPSASMNAALAERQALMNCSTVLGIALLISLLNWLRTDISSVFSVVLSNFR